MMSESEKSTNKMAEELRCPITQLIMVDPCIASDGFTYERKAILKWISSNQPPTSPLTNQVLSSSAVMSNRTLRSTISRFLEQHPQFKKEYDEAEALVNDDATMKNKLNTFKILASTPIDCSFAFPSAAATQTSNGAGSSQNHTSLSSGMNISQSTKTAETATINSDDTKLPLVITCSKTSLSDRKGVTAVWEYDLSSLKWQKTIEWPSSDASSSFTSGTNGNTPSMPSKSSPALGSTGSFMISKPKAFDLSSAINTNSPSTFSTISTASTLTSSSTSSWLDSSVSCMTLLNTNRKAGWEEYVAGNRDNSLAIFRLTTAENGSVTSFSAVNTADSFRKKDGHKDMVRCITTIRPYSLLGDDENNEASNSTKLRYCDRVVSGSRDMTLRLWRRKSTCDPGTENQIWDCASVLNGHKDFVNCCDSIEGSIVSGASDWDLLLWDAEVANSDPIQELSGHSLAVRCCSFSPSSLSSRLIASGSDDETVKIWDPRTSRSCTNTLKCDSIVLTCTWSQTYSVGNSPLPFLVAGGGIPNDSLSADSGNVGGWVRVWDPRTWKTIGDCSLMGTPELPEYIIAKGTNAKGDKTHLSVEGDIPPSRIAHRHAVQCLQTLRLSKSGDKVGIVSGGSDKKIRLWQMSLIGEEYSSPRHSLTFDEFHKLPIDTVCVSGL